MLFRSPRVLGTQNMDLKEGVWTPYGTLPLAPWIPCPMGREMAVGRSQQGPLKEGVQGRSPGGLGLRVVMAGIGMKKKAMGQGLGLP